MRSPLLIDLPEIIETPRLRLQMPKAGFGENLYPAIIDGYEDYVKWMDWTLPIPTLETVEEECRKHHAEFILRNNIRYIIIEKSTGEVVGRTGFPAIQTNWRIPQVGIAYFIRHSKRKNGYATESAHAMSLLALRVLKARKVEIYCDAENTASCGVPEKLNFQLEYTQKGGWPRQDGELANLKTYALFSEDQLPKLDITW